MALWQEGRSISTTLSRSGPSWNGGKGAFYVLSDPPAPLTTDMTSLNYQHHHQSLRRWRHDGNMEGW